MAKIVAVNGNIRLWFKDDDPFSRFTKIAEILGPRSRDCVESEYHYDHGYDDSRTSYKLKEVRLPSGINGSLDYFIYNEISYKLVEQEDYHSPIISEDQRFTDILIVGELVSDDKKKGCASPGEIVRWFGKSCKKLAEISKVHQAVLNIYDGKNEWFVSKQADGSWSKIESGNSVK